MTLGLPGHVVPAVKIVCRAHGAQGQPRPRLRLWLRVDAVPCDALKLLNTGTPLVNAPSSASVARENAIAEEYAE